MSGDILALTDDNRALSASQLHLLLHPTQEEEDDLLRKSEEVLCINVGGKRHWIMARNFVNFPGTRLGRLARAKTREEILNLCDKYWPGDEISGEDRLIKGQIQDERHCGLAVNACMPTT